MARYGTETSLPPRRVLRLAREFFGPESAWGLALSSDTLTTIGFHGAGGSIEVSASPLSWLKMHPAAYAARWYVWCSPPRTGTARIDPSSLLGDGSGSACPRPWCGRARLKYATYSRSRRDSCRSPRTSR